MPEKTRARRQPLQARSRATVERILLAAGEIVVAGGVEAATMTAILASAEVSAASLYHFFADREQIFDTLLERELDELDRHVLAEQSRGTAASLSDAVEQELEALAQFHERHPLFLRLWFGGRISPAVIAKVQEYELGRAEAARKRLLDAGLVSAASFTTTDALLAVEVGDRVLDLAFRGRKRADRAILAKGAWMLCDYLERETRAAQPAPRDSDS